MLVWWPWFSGGPRMLGAQRARELVARYAAAAYTAEKHRARNFMCYFHDLHYSNCVKYKNAIGSSLALVLAASAGGYQHASLRHA